MISLKNTAVIFLTIGIWALLITVWMYPSDGAASAISLKEQSRNNTLSELLRLYSFQVGHKHQAYEIEGLADVTIMGVEGMIRRVVSECTVKDNKINCNP